jgi:hypothetical protein
MMMCDECVEQLNINLTSAEIQGLINNRRRPRQKVLTPLFSLAFLRSTTLNFCGKFVDKPSCFDLAQYNDERNHNHELHSKYRAHSRIFEEKNKSGFRIATESSF